MLLWGKSAPVWEKNQSRGRTVRPPAPSCSPLQKQVSLFCIYPGMQQEWGLQPLPKSPQGCERQPAAQTHKAFGKRQAAELNVQTGSRGKPAALFSHHSALLPPQLYPPGTSKPSQAQHAFLLSSSVNLSGSSTSITWRGTWGPGGPQGCAWKGAMRVPGLLPPDQPRDRQSRTLRWVTAQPRLLWGRRLSPSIDSRARAAVCDPGDTVFPAPLPPAITEVAREEGTSLGNGAVGTATLPSAIIQ